MLPRVATICIVLTLSAFGQGRCRDGYGTQICPLPQGLATAPIRPLFSPTGWKTIALDHITFLVPDYKKEAAFYIALMGWKQLSDDGKQATLVIGTWGTAIFKAAPERNKAIVDSVGWVVEPWNAKSIETELRNRGLNPIPANAPGGFESFHIKDPNGFDLHLSNKHAATPTASDPAPEAPFASTGWTTVWLDHFSYNAPDYKQAASFYMNLLGWKPTYDEGSQHELMIGQIGDIIIRGGNANDPNFSTAAPARAARDRIDHISFGISPWDTDGVKAELEKRGLKARVDTSTKDDIHVAAFKSYHTTTPNGFDLQISFVTQANRLALPNAVKPH